ncbi:MULTISPECIES: hypothetical protein [Paracoccus]|uniref:hypothetical protein n=1 Tax=Paracoccus TaxID=265 RepID=UPI0003B502CA|nr:MULTISPECIES: hypothetical protein [Paracoccus]
MPQSALAPDDNAREELAARLMAIPALLALIAALTELLWRGSGIAHTPGAWLAVAATAALFLGALLTGALRPGGFRTFLTVMLLVGGLLTILCAWFLESGLVMAAVAVMLVAWLIFILIAR